MEQEPSGVASLGTSTTFILYESSRSDVGMECINGVAESLLTSNQPFGKPPSDILCIEEQLGVSQCSL